MVTSLSVTFPVERHAQLRLTMPTARRLAIVLLVFLPFVGEMLYGLSLYLGIEAPSGARIIRAGVSAAGLAVLLWRPLRPLSLYIWALCGLWLILFCFWAGTSRFMDLIAEVAVFAKLLYGFFLLALVYPLASRESNAEFLKFTLRALTTSISSLVILSFITGVGLET